MPMTKIVKIDDRLYEELKRKAEVEQITVGSLVAIKLRELPEREREIDELKKRVKELEVKLGDIRESKRRSLRTEAAEGGRHLGSGHLK